ncbi:MAG: prephenate dehydrogenase/arogenate dehydrogenase family protein [Methanomassiliicoccales archaeon]|nr:prephenate dehydrogenase/arogenate dehydrogenase family protein [Methanomassiliicoccales archaeon]
MTDSVEGIRWKIEEIDNEILDLIKKRMSIALAMGHHKVEKEMPVRDIRVEEQVRDRYLARAKDVGISDAAAIELSSLIVRESVEAQARLPRQMKPRKVLVVGGGGAMGQWLCRFFSSRGHEVKVFDTLPGKSFPNVTSLEKGVKEADVIAVSSHISATADMLRQIFKLKPKGLVFDIASVKSPLIEVLKEGADQGLLVCSIHPMFGPSASFIFARNLIVCDCGSDAAVNKFMPLLNGTGANVIQMPLEDHDKYIAVVLGMSHALNLAFFEALRHSDFGFEELKRVSSTTFERQMNTSSSVARESPNLYYEIQHLNPYNQDVLDAFISALREVQEAGTDEDRSHLIRIMQEGRKYFEVKQ